MKWLHVDVVFFLYFGVLQDGSIWLFTTEKFEGSRPLTIQVNFEGFCEGIPLNLSWICGFGT